MPRYILDTDSVTYQQLGRPAIVERLAQVAPGEVATTVITLYEQLRGRLAAINRQQGETALQQAYQRLQATQAYFCQVPIMPYDTDSATLYRQLLNQRLRIGAQDLKIAAITLSRGAVLVTSNRRHFDQVPGLQLEDWSA